MNIEPGRRYLLIGGMAFLAIVLFFGSNILLRRIAPKPAAPREGLPAPAGTAKTNIISRPPQNPKEIIYTKDGFSPGTVTVNSSDPFGCMVSAMNRSGGRLKIGVSPHSDAGDPGSDYGETPSNEQTIFDARYPGFAQTRLHNHYRPGHSFVVIFGDGCR